MEVARATEFFGPLSLQETTILDSMQSPPNLQPPPSLLLNDFGHMSSRLPSKHLDEFEWYIERYGENERVGVIGQAIYS